MIKLELSHEQIDQLVGTLEGTLFEGALQSGVEDSTALLLNRIRTRFLNTTAPDGSIWPVSEAAKDRAASGRGGGTLFDTGNLFHSIQAYSVSPYVGAIATDVWYAPIHNFGEGKMPRREFMGFSDSDEKLALAVFVKKITEVFK